MVRNVTVTGVEYGRAVSVHASWGITVASVSERAVQGVTGICPAGRYCPAGTSQPIVCDAGKFSTQIGRSTPCIGACQPNYYCPDPGKRVACPANTHSDWGKKSQADCKCDGGYQCVYRKQIQVNLVVNVPYRVWTSGEGDTVKAALVQAVAESAGVSVGSVKIEKVSPSVVPGPAVVSSSGRRLLGTTKERAAMVKVSVEGADRLDGLQERLSASGRGGMFQGGARVHWERVDKVKVLTEPFTATARNTMKRWGLSFWS